MSFLKLKIKQATCRATIKVPLKPCNTLGEEQGKTNTDPFPANFVRLQCGHVKKQNLQKIETLKI